MNTATTSGAESDEDEYLSSRSLPLLLASSSDAICCGLFHGDTNDRDLFGWGSTRIKGSTDPQLHPVAQTGRAKKAKVMDNGGGWMDGWKTRVLEALESVETGSNREPPLSETKRMDHRRPDVQAIRTVSRRPCKASALVWPPNVTMNKRKTPERNNHEMKATRKFGAHIIISRHRRPFFCFWRDGSRTGWVRMGCHALTLSVAGIIVRCVRFQRNFAARPKELNRSCEKSRTSSLRHQNDQAAPCPLSPSFPLSATAGRF
ncbi:hypothetical protein FN846DRAFT_886826 [Sphaerosporella brunnea]|uniref:Uncharacterized protein n=1 Tax=Sphaerosporella brunnea TaxID=1250544 RepID=A0A5J5F8U5_9PEZI|nr:hypothetical protein FN846DRAFT_886826 [Sphaerosporella brunnea]